MNTTPHVNVGDEPETEGWLARYQNELAEDADYVAEGLALHVAEQVVQIMDDRGITRAELSEMLGVSRAYVTKVLNAPPNLTLRSIAAVAIALGGRPAVEILTRDSGRGLRPTDLVLGRSTDQPKSTWLDANWSSVFPSFSSVAGGTFPSFSSVAGDTEPEPTGGKILMFPTQTSTERASSTAATA